MEKLTVKILAMLVAYGLTGLMMAVLLNKSLDGVSAIKEVLMYLLGGLTGYIMHGVEDNISTPRK